MSKEVQRVSNDIAEFHDMAPNDAMLPGRMQNEAAHGSSVRVQLRQSDESLGSQGRAWRKRVDQRRFEQSLKLFARAADRRGALQSIAAGGAAVMAAVGFSQAVDAGNTRHDRKNKKARTQHSNADGSMHDEKKKGKQGPTGPTGPAGGSTGSQGPTGPTGPNGSTFGTLRVIGDSSLVLSADVFSQVSSVAACAAAGQLLSCGWLYTDAASNYVSTITQVLPREDTDLESCEAFLSRTEDVPAPAGRIQAVAIRRSKRQCRQ